MGRPKVFTITYKLRDRIVAQSEEWALSSLPHDAEDVEVEGWEYAEQREMDGPEHDE